MTDASKLNSILLQDMDDVVEISSKRLESVLRAGVTEYQDLIESLSTGVLSDYGKRLTKSITYRRFKDVYDGLEYKSMKAVMTASGIPIGKVTMVGLEEYRKHLYEGRIYRKEKKGPDEYTITGSIGVCDVVTTIKQPRSRVGYIIKTVLTVAVDRSMDQLMEAISCDNYWYSVPEKKLYTVRTHEEWMEKRYDKVFVHFDDVYNFALDNGYIRVVICSRRLSIYGKFEKDCRNLLKTLLETDYLYFTGCGIETMEEGDFEYFELNDEKQMHQYVRTGALPRDNIYEEALNTGPPMIEHDFHHRLWYDANDNEFHLASMGRVYVSHQDWAREKGPLKGALGLSPDHTQEMFDRKWIRVIYYQRAMGGDLLVNGDDLKLIRKTVRAFMEQYPEKDFEKLYLDIGTSAKLRTPFIAGDAVDKFVRRGVLPPPRSLNAEDVSENQKRVTNEMSPKKGFVE